MVCIERSAHLAPLNLKPHQPSLEAQSRTPLTPCSVRDVFLSFPAWNGPGCYQDAATRRKTEVVIAALKPGDRIRIAKTRNRRDQNPWHIFARVDDGWHRIGKMQRGFTPGILEGELYAEVFALVSWCKADSGGEQHGRIFLDRWFTVVPEWGTGAIVM